MGRRDSMPRAGDFDLLNTVRERTARSLKSIIGLVNAQDEDCDLSALCVIKTELESKWSDFEDAFNEHEASLIGCGNLSDLNGITTDFVTLQNSHVKAKITISQLISGANDGEESASAQSSNGQATTPTNTNARPAFKMAPMKISSFSGNLSEWTEFKATIRAVLIDPMPDIQRLQHLKDALLGDARILVSHILPGTDNAFDKAVKLLTDRYENTRATVNGHLHKFYAIPFAEKPSVEYFRNMLTSINGLIAALNCLEINTDSWDAILIFHVSQRFDTITLNLWEEKLGGSRTVPKLSTLLIFLQTRITVLETTDSFSSCNKQIERASNNWSKPQTNQRPSFDAKRTHDKHKTFYTLKSSYECGLCKKNHLSSRCTEISQMSMKDRHAVVARNKLCSNCFYPHDVSQCPFEPACKKCNEPHHTLLHTDNKQLFLNMADLSITEESCADEENSMKGDDKVDDVDVSNLGEHFYHVNDTIDDNTLLATAIVPIRKNGRSALLKSLIDQGSTTNLITIRGCNLLRLKFPHNKTAMFGVGNTPVGNVLGRAVFEIGSTNDKTYRLQLKAIVVQSIGNITGFSKSKISEWPHIHKLQLADPHFFESGKIDLLLGGSAHADVMLDGLIKGERHQPIAQNSKLGWIISGNTQISSKCMAICRHINVECFDDSIFELNNRLKLFWELEEANYKSILTDEQQMAETVFAKSIQRDTSGKFIVDLPFKLDPFIHLGESYQMAKRRYASLQRRFEKNPNLKPQYDAILEEYLTLNHMELVTDNPKFQCFLPHHAVVKEASSTTKVRIVFDASAKSNTGMSLNDCLCVGPVIQSDLFDLLINWRKYEFAVSSDIEKMYRMMFVNRKHTDFQTILWHRPNTNGIAAYRLLTVTFGTSSAPYQATRGVHEVGNRIKNENPQLADIIQHCFYVDDFLKSFPSIEMAIQTRNEITDLLAKYGFNLRKWKSNDERVLIGVSDDNRETCIDFNSTFKTLGIAWHAKNDDFHFKSLDIDDTKVWTKRNVLSAITQMFDPLGWLAPFVIRAKILMQHIWRIPNGIDWDTELPDHITSQWKPIFLELTSPLPITVPRWIKLSDNKDTVEIHSFCDASNLAYACCVYVRVIHENGNVSCNLVTAKTKVAPVRATTIPRLELCGAQLLAKLTTRCIQALSLTEFKLFAWCDSKIVLAWLATHPSKWATFVANRVSEIQDSVSSSHWMHVPSKQNPADIASRGCGITELRESEMWWHGPSFLTNSSENYPKQDHKLPIDNAPERRKNIQVFHITEPQENYILERFEDLSRLLHFTCLTLRLLNHMRKRDRLIGPPTASEIDDAEAHWIKLIQQTHFALEIDRIKSNRSLPKGNILLKLNPFIDEKGYLRMNGRVGNAELLQQKTSIILPAKSKFVLLIIRYAHQHQTLHGGMQLTLRALRERFYIIHARSQVGKTLNRCMICYRFKKHLLKQQMAELPSFRTQQAKPFSFVGCDYAGPFKIKTSELRNAPFEKGYIALFICLTTKAIHLELASDLTPEEYIMALENFIARRGIPNLMYTDNGTNFTCGEKDILKLHEQWLSQNNELTRLLTSKRITFKRIPARASHMAGIWERSVGLVKYHLKRVMKDTKLTARRFEYVLRQVECCVNSRPLWAVTPNADDIEVITPSHFFNFQPINTLPRPDLSHLKMNQLDQYQYLYRLYTEFWKCWSKEYLDQFQPRAKWPEKHPNVKVGQIVVVSDDNIPPSRWPLGRVTAVHPAKDGLIRVVDVKINDTITKRPIHRLGIIPIPENEELTNSSDELSIAGENVV